jgi:hypothetical protein
MASDAPIDPSIIHDIMWYGAGCVGIVTLGATIVGGIAFWKTQSGGAKTFSLLVQRADATRLVTVLAIIAAAFVLTLIGRIESGAVISILSGVAGYVLGGVNASRAASEKDD